MALTCGFYNSIYGDRKYSAIQLSSIFDGIIKDGIFATVGDAFTVSAGSEMQVIVGPGRAWFNHSWTLNDANLPVEVDDAEVVLDRIDAVVIEVNSDDSVRDNTVKIVKGRPSSTPEKPELLDTETVHQYALAYVTVRSGVTEITNADIENAVGTTETPFITGLLETIDATELMNQWNGQFQDWLREAGTSLEDWETQSISLMAQWTVEFNDWFEHLQNELDENQAAHLQHQIDELRVKSGMSAKILINSDPGSTVTVTKPDGTVVVATQVLGTTTQWECSTGEYGVHEITSVLNGESASKSLNVDTCKIYTIDDDHMHADITVTFPSGFTCRCQGGSENLYATSNPYTFTVHNQTTYTITASAPGITYTETVTISSSAQSVSMFCPSVENAPTDDVQMWLFFGGITDKSYTTLTEVLADSTTIATLMAEHNAVDYMVRSKSWASNKGLVPQMTSNTTPSGECVASSVYNDRTDLQPWKVFDNDSSSKWASASNNTVGAYIGYKFTSALVLTKVYILQDALNQTNVMSKFKVQGYNSNTLAYESSEIAITGAEGNYTFVNTTPCDEYRVVCTEATSGSSNVNVYTIQFYSVDGNGITEDSTAMTYIGLNNYASNTLTADVDWNTAIQNSAYFESVDNAKAPTMTSNNTPSGLAFASSEYDSNTRAYMAFDGVTSSSNEWASSSNDNVGGYIGYIFTNPMSIKKLRLFNYNDSYSAGNIINGFKLQGSDDTTTGADGTWTDIGTEQSAVAGDNYFIYNNNTNYKGLRVYCTRVTSPVNIKNLNILELQFYGRQDV